MNNKLIIVSGMSGSGKTFLISQTIQDIDKLSVVTAVTTREARIKDKNLQTDKTNISEREFLELKDSGKLCCVNNVYGNFYAFYRDDIERKLRNGSVILEYKASMIDDIKKEYRNSFALYVYSSNSEKILQGLDGRKDWKKRFESDLRERDCILGGLFNTYHIDELFENEFNSSSVERFTQRIAYILDKEV